MTGLFDSIGGIGPWGRIRPAFRTSIVDYLNIKSGLGRVNTAVRFTLEAIWLSFCPVRVRAIESATWVLMLSGACVNGLFATPRRPGHDCRSSTVFDWCKQRQGVF